MKRGLFLATGAALTATQRSFPAAAQGAADLAALERRAGGRLGVYAIDTGSGRTLEHRAHERFAMCSTFKLLAAGAVLARVDDGNEDLSRRVAIADADILEYAPVTKAHLRLGSMTIAELCAAAVELSDNTAANLLLHSLAGPAGVTRFARKIGDPVTRLDRNEPALNTALPGDPRDTTAPAAMAADLRTLLLGSVLKPASRARLRTWLVNCRTGDTLLRAGLPAHWKTGDKTGNGDNATRNDVAITWPPGRAPLIIACYFTGSKASATVRARVHAGVARIVVRSLG